MPARNSPRRGARSRKRRARPQGTPKGAADAAAARAPAALDRSEIGRRAPELDARPRRTPARARKQQAHGESALYSPRGVGARPRAPWHPLPLSELLILVGAIGAAIGFSRGVSHGAAPMFAGLAAVLIGTLEFTLREHLSGYRSHAIIIAVLGVAVFHSAIALGVAAFTHVPRALNVALIALDIAVFAVLFKVLRARFLDARRERVFAGAR
ncbi:MAG TPA: hypothetical protein VH115_08240 [Solirubrobacteraceae bacterium]|nr:hypothetical protein [Solirubrobacteraceae bacterium]